ncbi:MAG: PD-(D/E)XK nuclease family protein [Candidatus Omnitrophota bacterium]
MGRIFTTDFTKSFIGELSDYILRGHMAAGKNPARLAVVFGGKRPAHFLKRELARRSGKSFISPKFYTMDAFMNELANVTGDLRAASDLEDRFTLYQLAHAIAPELLKGRSSFAKFLPWAGDILNFINQLDLESVGPEALINIQESAHIGYPVPENINRMLEKILLLRDVFHARLKAEGRTTRGEQYRRAGENVSLWDAGRYDEIIFANFFYFHKTEVRVVRALHTGGRATLIFQGDQRKWRVLEHIAGQLGVELKEGTVPTPVSFDLRIYSAADVHGGAAIARDVLEEIGDKHRTVVVLPDPEALVPLLSTLSVKADDFNVSMGYPLRRGSLYLLIQAVFKAQLSMKEGRYYARDYLALIRHPFVKNLRREEGDDGAVIMRILVHKIEEVLKGRVSGEISGRSFIALEDVVRERIVFTEVAATLSGMGIPVDEEKLILILRGMHSLFFGVWETLRDLQSFGAALAGLLDATIRRSFMGNYPLNLNIAARMYEVGEQFRHASFSGEIFSREDLFRIFEEHVGREMVRFQGTPLKGLQILGLEETRSLDFDHVIVLDANEGILPSIRVRASLIPREVMGQLDLDSLSLEEEIQRYQFMRLVSSAKTVHLICQKNKEKEPSRFLEELVWEKQVQDGKTDPFPTIRAGFAVRADQHPRMAVKTPAMIAFLKDFSYSASSVNAYVANPYTFYINYVLGLRENEDLLDEPDAVLIGNFMHGFLEELYKPFDGRVPDFGASFEKRLWAIFNRRFEETLSRRMRTEAFLVRGVMEHKLRAFLDFERERCAGIAAILGLEKEYVSRIVLPSGTFRFKARIDRIEEDMSGAIRVLDYKTGSADDVPPPVLTLPPDAGRREIFETMGSFQLPLYVHMMAEAYPGRRVEAGLFSLREAKIRTISRDRMPMPAPDVFLVPYKEALDRMMAEILDPSQPFMDDELRKFDL